MINVVKTIPFLSLINTSTNDRDRNITEDVGYSVYIESLPVEVYEGVSDFVDRIMTMLRYVLNTFDLMTFSFFIAENYRYRRQ